MLIKHGVKSYHCYKLGRNYHWVPIIGAPNTGEETNSLFIVIVNSLKETEQSSIARNSYYQISRREITYLIRNIVYFLLNSVILCFHLRIYNREQKINIDIIINKFPS